MAYEKKEIKCRRQGNMTVRDIVLENLGMPEAAARADKNHYHVNGIKEAAGLLYSAAKAGLRIQFYTDYDADGIMSALILKLVCRALCMPKERYEITVPRRFTDGYGIKPRNVETMGCGLLVTADNGIAAAEAVRLAKAKGMKVIVLDHHLPLPDENGRDILPEADVLVDPHVTGGDYTEYCGAGLCYRVLLEVLDMPCGIDEASALAVKQEAACWAAVATVGDSVPLTGENRRIVKLGLALMKKRCCAKTLGMLLDKLWLKGNITATDLAFKLVPCINAWGRLEDDGSRQVAETLGCRRADERRIMQMVDRNKERKKLTGDAVARIGTPERKAAILVYDRQCPQGIAGIAAGRLAEDYGVPAIVLTESETPGMLRGSGRSPEGIDLKAMLDSCPVKPAEYGGHPAACGMSVEEGRVDEFFSALLKCAEATPAPEKDSTVYYDVNAEPHIMTLTETYRQILCWGPYGEGNPEPVVCVKNLALKRDENNTFKVSPMVTLMGADFSHAKLHTECGMEVLMFGGAKDFTDMGEPMRINAVGTLSWEVFKGEGRLSMQALYVEPA